MLVNNEMCNIWLFPIFLSYEVNTNVALFMFCITSTFIIFVNNSFVLKYYLCSWQIIMGTTDCFVSISGGLHSDSIHPSFTFIERGSAAVLWPSSASCSTHIPQWCVTLSHTPNIIWNELTYRGTMEHCSFHTECVKLWLQVCPFKTCWFMYELLHINLQNPAANKNILF
jgi:hypothetical protein